VEDGGRCEARYFACLDAWWLNQMEEIYANEMNSNARARVDTGG
jgi:hypothetical protein